MKLKTYEVNTIQECGRSYFYTKAKSVKGALRSLLNHSNDFKSFVGKHEEKKLKIVIKEIVEKREAVK